jgi:hypothetical protein
LSSISSRTQAPWLELKDYPKQRTAELAARRAHSVPAADGFVPSLQRPFRLLATHLAPAGHAQAHRLAQLPLRDDVRYVVAVSRCVRPPGTTHRHTGWPSCRCGTTCATW